MGISGLHGLLRTIQKPCNVTKFKGQVLGVDAYGWLHRGTIACAYELVFDKPTTKYVDFALNRIFMLLRAGVTPYLVFDGGFLPSKQATEASRAARRDESKRLGEDLKRQGRPTEALREFQKAVDVTPYMARMLIEQLKKHKIPYVVAPYEADAQLVYLEKKGIINGIISEDSDMLVFGAKRLLSKLDKNGDCIELNRSDFTSCRDISLIGWTDENFRHMCILSGCDYLANIPRMGLKTAYQSVRRYRTVDRVIKMIRFDANLRVPPGYLDDFRRAEQTFLHQRVFCPITKRLVMLNPLKDNGDGSDMPFIGAEIESQIAIGIASGDIDPLTKEPIELKESYPERARMIRTSRQSITSDDVKKPVREVTDFFTPKRMPLTELDPNSLTPSPSQYPRPLLSSSSSSRHNRRSLIVSQVSTPPSITARRAVSKPNTPIMNSNGSDNGNSTGNIVEEFLSRASKISQPQVQKRQRLCSDASIDSDLADLSSISPTTMTELSSRYFASGPGSCKKLKSSRLRIFSDSGPTGGSKTSVYDEERGEGVHHDKELGSPLRIPSNNERSPAGNSFATLPSTSVRDIDSRRSSLKLKERFSFSPAEANQPVASTSSSPSLVFKKPLPVTRTLTHSFQSRTTPLQRLKLAALSRSKSMDSLSCSSLPQAPLSSRRLPTSDFIARRPSLSLSRSTGSEDMIIPGTSSDGECSEDGEIDGQNTATAAMTSSSAASAARLDLKKFAFGS